MANFTERISVIIDSKVDGATAGFKKFTSDIKAAEGASGKLKAGFSSLTSGLKANAGTIAAAGGAALIAFADDILDAGVALEQMDAKADVVFGDSLGKIENWAAESASAMGLTERATIGAAAAMADLLKPMGFTAEAAAEQAITMVDLSGALAAWSSGQYDAAEVSQILSKAMLGEREQLKSLGISITEAEVSSLLLAKGQNKLTGSALAQAKAMATQQLIMEKSVDAQKAWTDGSMDSTKAANKSKASFAELSEQLTEALVPIMKELVPILADVADMITPILGPLADLIGMIHDLQNIGEVFGTSFNDEMAANIKLAEDLAAAQAKVEPNLKNNATASLEYRDALDEAGEAQGDAKRHGDALNEMLADQTDALTDAIEGMYDLEEATMATDGAYSEYEASLAAGESTLAELRQQQIDIAKGALQTAQEFARAQGASDGSRASYMLQVTALEEMKKKYPLLASEIQRYIDKLKSIPGVVNTSVGISYGPSSKPGSKYASGTKSAKPGFALVGEQGPEIVLMGGGEEVLTASETSRARSGGMRGGLGGGNTYLTVNVPNADPNQVVKIIKEHMRRNGGSL